MMACQSTWIFDIAKIVRQLLLPRKLWRKQKLNQKLNKEEIDDHLQTAFDQTARKKKFYQLFATVLRWSLENSEVWIKSLVWSCQ